MAADTALHMDDEAQADTDAPLISIIVPVYNSEQYLTGCIESILNQSYPHFELIAVDDGSTDSSGEILNALAKRDDRIRVIHQNNTGIGGAQNTGLDHANGEFIAFADNDDLLDRHNFEFLLHAIQSTGADMSKARWQSFGVSDLQTYKQQADEGARAPTSISVYKNAMHAYQHIFCKSLRCLGNALGKRGEARYFNEANWCRLYRREIWDGVRFPLGQYAQDLMVAGLLHARTRKVAHIDAVLYYWMQSPTSVTHKEHTFTFYHDNALAGLENFSRALNAGVLPARSYYIVKGSIHKEKDAIGSDKPTNLKQHEKDLQEAKALIAKLSWSERLWCDVLCRLRLLENVVYDRTVKNKQ